MLYIHTERVFTARGEPHFSHGCANKNLRRGLHGVAGTLHPAITSESYRVDYPRLTRRARLDISRRNIEICPREVCAGLPTCPHRGGTHQTAVPVELIAQMLRAANAR